MTDEDLTPELEEAKERVKAIHGKPDDDRRDKAADADLDKHQEDDK